MDHPLIDLINQKIAAAQAEGAFDDLEGAGHPLPRQDDPDNALLNRVLKESGAVPEFVRLRQELERLRQELLDCTDRSLRKSILKEMSMKETQIAFAREAGR